MRFLPVSSQCSPLSPAKTLHFGVWLSLVHWQTGPVWSGDTLGHAYTLTRPTRTHSPGPPNHTYSNHQAAHTGPPHHTPHHTTLGCTPGAAPSGSPESAGTSVPARPHNPALQATLTRPTRTSRPHLRVLQIALARPFQTTLARLHLGALQAMLSRVPPCQAAPGPHVQLSQTTKSHSAGPPGCTSKPKQAHSD